MPADRRLGRTRPSQPPATQAAEHEPTRRIAAMVAQPKITPKLLGINGLIAIVDAFGTMPSMVEPRVVPRAEHPISRRDIDPDALKVLYRLRQVEHIAYLVGGSVRDLLLGRRPRISTSARRRIPIRSRSCSGTAGSSAGGFVWRTSSSGNKVIEVATFRRQVRGRARRSSPDGVPAAGEAHADCRRRANALHPSRQHVRHAGRGRVPPRLHDQRALLRHRDVLDHRLRRRPRGSARAASCARSAIPKCASGKIRSGCCARSRSRRGSTSRIDPPILDAIRLHRHEIARSSPPRLLEEYYKILRAGSAERTFRDAGGRSGCSSRSPTELHRGAADALWQSLAALDAYRRQFDVDAGHADQRDPARQPARAARARSAAIRTQRRRSPDAGGRRRGGRGRPARSSASCRWRAATSSGCGRSRRCSGGCATLGQTRARKRALTHRSIFREALTWMEIHGDAPEARRALDRRCSPRRRRRRTTRRRRGARRRSDAAGRASPPAARRRQTRPSDRAAGAGRRRGALSRRSRTRRYAAISSIVLYGFASLRRSAA